MPIYTQSIITGMYGLPRPVKRPIQRGDYPRNSDMSYTIPRCHTDQLWNSFFVKKGRDNSVVRAPDSWLKGASLNPCRSGMRIFFSRVNFLCWILLWYLFLLRVTTVARKRSQSCCQKCRWRVTAKHTYMWLCMKWQGAWLYGVHRTCAETAAISCGTSHASAVSTPLQWISGGGDSSVVRVPDLWLKGRGFKSLQERQENFLLQG